MRSRPLRIGLVGVVPASGGDSCLGLAKGAYVIAIAQAESIAEYQEAVSRRLAIDGLIAFEFEDVELFDQRASAAVLDVELHQLATRSEASGDVCFYRFHTFEHLDG